MENRQNATEDPTEPSTRPKDYVEKMGASLDLRETVHDLYEAVSDCSGGSIEGIRLGFWVPPEGRAKGHWKKRASWLLYRCELSQHKFAVPKNAPVPVLVMEKPKGDGNGTWSRRKIIHPDLLHDRHQLLRELFEDIDSEIRELLYDLCEAFNLVQALSEADEIPSAGASEAYPRCQDGRRGYEAVGRSRPMCDG
jgi:hypothetical protein